MIKKNIKITSRIPIEADYEMEIDICTLESFVRNTPTVNLSCDEESIQAVLDKLKDSDELCIDNLDIDEKETLQITLENYIEYGKGSDFDIFDPTKVTNIKTTSYDTVVTAHLECSEYED